MTATFATTPLRFAKQEQAIRRAAAALAVVLGVGVVAAMGEMADRAFDKTMLAQAEASIPVEVVVITAKRLQG
jgi:hypothetical protein